ncbi:putative transporter small subunit [Bordetella bronchiseptica]|nr:putative transporter small subunit [Bordetella bronchiseptica]KDD15565.1 hypothetical protein L523_2651 [Bordetella bronchiseptica MBORD731]
MLLTLYFLAWPVVSAAVLLVLIATLWRDIRDARATGKSMI